MIIGITGANGFLGSYLFKTFKKKYIIKKIKSPDIKMLEKLKKTNFFFENISFNNQFKELDTLIHCYGVSKPNKYISENYYYLLNVIYTKYLILLCKSYKIKKFIFISTAQLAGEYSAKDKLISLNSSLKPENKYSYSKLLAEKVIIKNCNNKTSYFIIRSPLIYGPGVTGSFLNLLNLANKCKILPLKNLCELRSYISLYNLGDFIFYIINLKKIKNKIFYVSDGNDISIKDLVLNISFFMKKKIILYNFPIKLANLISNILNIRFLKKIIYPFRINLNETKIQTKWFPKYSFKKGIKKTVQNYLGSLN